MDENAMQDRAEKAYLEEVVSNIEATLSDMNEELSGSQRELTDAQRQIWEDEAQFIRTFDDVVTLSQLQQEYGTAQARLYDRIRLRRNLRNAKGSPYFGRIDFAETDFVETEPDDRTPLPEQDAEPQPVSAEPGDDIESIYIGSVSIDEHNSRRRLVYDWRTPVASLFYEQGPGMAAYRCPFGISKGKLLLKRQYGIEDGELKYWFDTDTKIDDEILGMVLSEGATSHLKTIVKSIQKEQNQAIRAGINRDLLVCGPAGSGKSSVGMHRCAWLLYHCRGKLTSGNMLIVSSSGIFADYVSHILPELGEQELRRTVFSSLLDPFLPEDRSTEDRFRQMEWLMTHPGEDRGISVKSSLGFLQYLQEELKNLPLSVGDITVFEDTVCAREDLERIARPDRHSFLGDRILRLWDNIRERMEDYFSLHEAELIKKIRKESDEYIFDEDLPVVLLKKRSEILRKAESDFRAENGLEPETLYLRMLRAYSGDAALTEKTEKALYASRLPYEDALVMAYLHLALGRGKVFPQILHILMDEAQDLSVFAHAIVRLLFPKARFTVLADPGQRISCDGVGAEELMALYPEAERKELSESYRSTRMISDYAKQFLPENERYTYFNREGDPVVFPRGDLHQIVRETLEREKEGHCCSSVCVLTRTLAETRRLAPLFPELTPVTDSDQTLPEKPILMPLMFAKGLEFDTVLMLDDGQGDDHAKYVMATRALHRLYVADSSAEGKGN